MKYSNNKLENVIEELKKYSIILEEDDRKDLDKQLNRKSYLIYMEIIKLLNSFNHLNSYDDIKKFIKLNIRIRNHVHNFIVSIEESIRCEYILEKGIKDYTIAYKENLCKIINSLYPNDKDHFYHTIRNMRNDFSHLVYVLLDITKFKELFENLNMIMKLQFIDDIVVQKLKNNIRDEIKKMMPNIFEKYN